MAQIEWITTSTAAKETGIAKRTIIAAITSGKLPAEKLPGLTGAYLIKPESLSTWLDARR